MTGGKEPCLAPSCVAVLYRLAIEQPGLGPVTYHMAGALTER
jgi:hypothetical protein